MILTGRKLEEIGYALYREIWISTLSKKLRRSKRTIMRWRDSDAGLPMEVRQSLLHMIDDQFALLAEKRDQLAEIMDDMP